MKKVLLKRLSLSWIMSVGRPCLLKTWSCMSCAKPIEVRSSVVFTRITIFVALSTMLSMALCPASVIGRPVTRSTEIVLQGVSAISGNCRRPCGGDVLGLQVWQMWHCSTYFLMSCVMPFQKNRFCTALMVLSLPMWPANKVSWHCEMM